MHWRMPCRQQSVAKTQSEAESKRAVKPRASRLAGSARGRASRIGEAVQTRHRELVGRTKQRQKISVSPLTNDNIYVIIHYNSKPQNGLCEILSRIASHDLGGESDTQPNRDYFFGSL